MVILEAKELEIKHPDKENKSERKVLIKTTSVHGGKEQFKCDICDVIFGQIGTLNRHVATVHEGRKPFKCDICNAMDRKVN